jgi:serine phosphatase RsbU (regulator of sigma subunit)
MKLRTQLVAVFFLVAVLPLCAITLYAYQSSTRALRAAVGAEASRAAREMGERMQAVTANLGRRFDRLEEIPLPAPPRGAAGAGKVNEAALVAQVLGGLGDLAGYLEALEFIPGAPPAHHPPTPPAPPRAPLVIPLPSVMEDLRKDAEIGKLLGDALASGRPGGGTETHRRLVQTLSARAEEIARLVRARLETARGEGSPGHQKELWCDLTQGGATVGRLKAKVRTERLLDGVLSQTRREMGEIPFAIDSEGTLFTPDPADLRTLGGLAVGTKGGAAPRSGNWVVVTSADEETGLTFGIARPVGESLGEIRRASARNLGAGIGLAALALFGILPISRRLTHNLSDLTRGAGRLAAGDLDAQVPVRSRDELGQLAVAFNSMARDLKANQERLVEQERLRKELELCRRIQSELLPKGPLRHPFAEVQGVSIPAHELGGDFFNYFVLPGGEVALFMGDVSGKGVPAALLMANLQATLRARLPLEPDLAAFAASLDREVEASTPDAVYLTLFLGILDPARRALRYVNAGHETAYLLRRDGRLEGLESTGRPIGLVSGGAFQEKRVSVDAGDRLFLHTDGLTDAENAAGEAFGRERLETLLRGGPSGDPRPLLLRIEEAFQAHRAGAEAPDDATLLVLKVGDWAAA